MRSGRAALGGPGEKEPARLAGQWQWGGMESAAEVGAGGSSGSMGRSKAVAFQIGQHSAAVGKDSTADPVHTDVNGNDYAADTVWDGAHAAATLRRAMKNKEIYLFMMITKGLSNICT